MGVQVHGGMGFIEETGAAQHYRDAKILSIYEGTNGVQAADLVGRKLAQAGGELPWRLLAELRAGLPVLPGALRADAEAGVAAVERCTRQLQAAAEADREAAATPYLRLFATALGGCLLARGAAAAPTAGPGADWPGLAAFYLRQLLPPALALEHAVAAGAADLDPSLLAA